jgi:hypothetical protein
MGGGWVKRGVTGRCEATKVEKDGEGHDGGP